MHSQFEFTQRRAVINVLVDSDLRVWPVWQAHSPGAFPTKKAPLDSGGLLPYSCDIESEPRHQT